MRKAIAIGMAAAAATAACGQARSEDSGTAVSRDYEVGSFNRVELAGPYDVQVRTGSNPSVSARGPEKMIEHMIVEVKDGKLLIHPERQRGFFNFGWNSNGRVEVAVTVPQLNAATVAGSGGIKVDQVRGDRFEGTVAGSGDLGVGALDVRSLKLSIAGSGGAKASNGRAQNVSYDIAGSGDIDARGIQAQTADVSIAGSGSVAAHATDTAAVSIMGSGDVEMSGGAKCTVSKAGSGTVRCS